MTTSNPDIQPAVQHSAQVAIAGAGPVGLTIANYLGQMGVSVVLIEKLESLIPAPSVSTMRRCGRCRPWGW